MASRRETEREYDRIAASRMRSMGGGLESHVALGQPESIRLRWKLARMGAKCPALVDLVDSVAYQQTLQHQSLGVRYASVKRPQSKRKVWGQDLV